MREYLFHKIWEFYFNDFRYLTTTRAEPVQILTPGKLNTGDGPDFAMASILIENYIFHGSIELHVNCSDWYAHGHQNDPAYNKVVLHVVLDHNQSKPVQRQDGTYVPTVVVGSLIPAKMIDVIRQSAQEHELSCKGLIHRLSPHIIDKQLIIASTLYLDQKKTQLLSYYDTDLPLSQAWQKMVFLGWARGLGIPANSDSLFELAHFMWHHDDPADSFFNTLIWDYSSSRPGNHPIQRYRQLIHLKSALKQSSFSYFATKDPNQIFEFFTNRLFGGMERRKLLASIVVAPALSILGDLLGRPECIDAAKNYWFQKGFNTPHSIREPFKRAGVTHLGAQHSPGMVYQYKNFCKKKQCNTCLIFKNVVGG